MYLDKDKVVTYKYLKNIKSEKFCIETISKFDRSNIFNDSVFIAQDYYIDYENRRKLDRKTNTLHPRLEVGDCIILTNNPADSIYLVKKFDTILFVNLYPKDDW